MDYRARVVDRELAGLLASSGAIVIEGAKACGKTMTARQVAASEVLLDVDQAARAAAEVDPSLVLQGPTPRLLDEWQLVPQLWNHVRRAVDDREKPGQFILAGSAAPADDQTRHTGAMRFSRLRMRPMSLFESGTSTGQVSLADLLHAGAAKAGAESTMPLPSLADLICRGGWPVLLGLTTEQAQRRLRDYLEAIRRTDINEVEGVRRDPEKVGRMLRSLARNVATSADISTLAADVEGAESPLKWHTAADYLSALTRLFILEDQPAWKPHLRSRYNLRQAEKRHFVDPSLAAAALRAGPQMLVADLKLLGLLFESLVIRDLRVYAQAANARVLHYRDSDGLEVDAVVLGDDGRWMAFEVKLGGKNHIEVGARSLLTFSRRIDTARCGEPSCLAVIVASGYTYRRTDGVHVIPVAALVP